MNNFVSNLSTPGKILFYVAVVFGIALSVDALIIRPYNDKTAIIKDRIAMEKVVAKQEFKVLAYKNQILNEKKEFSKYITKELPDDNVVNADFLNALTSLADRSKINIVKSNPARMDKSNDFIHYYADLDCIGGLDDTVNFMHSVNSNEDLFKIVSFTMSPKRGGNADKPQVSTTMSVVKLIVRPEPE